MKSIASLIVAVLLGLGIVLSGVGSSSASVDSIAFYTYDSAEFTTVSADGENHIYVYCETGDYATGGGALLYYDSSVDRPFMRLVVSVPVGSSSHGPSTGWYVEYHNEDSNAHSFKSYVVCAHTV